MVEHLKSFGIGVAFVALLVVVSIATNFIMSYTGIDPLYVFIFVIGVFITYTFGDLARIILFDKKIEK